MGKEKFTLGLIAALHVYVLSRLNFFPYPELFVYPYLTNRGLLPYGQIFDQHFPGLMFLPINLGNLGMTSPEIARFWLYGLVIVSQVLLFLVGRKLFKSEKWALVACFLYLIWQPFFEGNTLWIDSFVMPLLLLAFYVTLRVGPSRRQGRTLFLAGLVLGGALVFKQVVGPLVAGLGLYLFIRGKYSLQKIWPFVAGAGILPLLMIIYFVKLGVWKDFYFWTVTFNLTTFAQMGRKYPDISSLIRSGFVFGPAIVAATLLAAKKHYLPVLFLLGSLLFAYARFDLVHLQPALPFALILIVLFLQKLTSRASFSLFALHLLLGSFLLYSFYSWNAGSKVFFFGEEDRLIASEVAKLTTREEKVFALATFPHIYQMADRLPSGDIFVFQFQWFMADAEERVLSGIISEPPKVVVRDLEAEVDGVNLVSAMPKLAKYIEDNYRVYKKVGTTEIMLPKRAL